MASVIFTTIQSSRVRLFIASEMEEKERVIKGGVRDDFVEAVGTDQFFPMCISLFVYFSSLSHFFFPITERVI